MPNQGWPATLPALQVDGLQETLPNQSVRTSMSVGVAKVRRRTTAAPYPVTGKLKLTGEQCALLETFYIDTLGGGSLPFDMKDPRTGGLYTFRFTAPPTINPRTPRATTAGGVFVASLSLERIPTVPEGVCYTLDGTQGQHTFCENTTVTVTLRSGRVTTEGINQLSVPVDRVCAFSSITGTAADPESVVFTYTNADGTTTVVYHRDDGWSIVPDTDHGNQPGGSGGTIANPTAADETDAPLFRHKGLSDPTGSTLCTPDDTLGQFVLVEATVAEGDAPIPAARAQGFKHWYAVCGTAVACHIITGNLGNFEYCEDSTLELEFISGRFIDTDADTVHDAIDITFPLIRIASFDSVSGTDSVTWAYADGDGTTSVTFHATNGWSYNADADHPPDPGATGTDVEVIAGVNSELGGDLDLFRHYGRTVFTTDDANAKCPIGGPAPSYPDFETKEAAEIEEATLVEGSSTRGISDTATTSQTQSLTTGTVGGEPQGPVGPGNGGDSVGWFIKLRTTVSTGSSTASLPFRALGFVDIAILCDDGSYIA